MLFSLSFAFIKFWTVWAEIFQVRDLSDVEDDMHHISHSR